MYIDEINVNNLGPIKKFHHKFNIFNLIYGPNECGKTYLVEFIISTLFKNKKEWNYLRLTKDEPTKGYITIKDINEKIFKIEYAKNLSLEDIITNKYNENENPYNKSYILPKLLVVKGSESKLDENTHQGLSCAFVKKVLSQKARLELVENNIKDSVIKKISISNSQIVNLDNKGIGKDYKTAIQNLTEINNLINLLINEYENLGVKHLEQKLSTLEEQREKLIKTKKLVAIKIKNNLNNVNKLINKFPFELIVKLEEKIKEYMLLVQTQKTLEQEHHKYLSLSQHLNWLANAKQSWQKAQDNAFNTFNLYMYGFLVICTLIVISAFISKYLSLIFAGTLAILSIAVLVKKQKLIQTIYNNQELELIKKEFESLFNKKLEVFADIEAEYKEQEKFSILCADKETKLLENRNKLLILENEINLLIKEINSFNISFIKLNELFDTPPIEKETLITDVLQNINNVKIEYQNYLKTKHELELKLKELGFEDNELNNDFEYTQDENVNDMSFNFKQFNEIEKQIAQIKEQINKKQNYQLTLKSQICAKTGSNITSNFNELLNDLYITRTQLQKNLYEITLKIISQFVVYQAIQKLKQDEETVIQKILEQPHITNILKAITNKYHYLKILEDEIIVESENENIPISKLSTGAKEQIFLALRLGFAQSIYKTPMFLILDDAFEHVDWGKRPNIIQSLIEFSKLGWQIICLTMDDNIKDLFIKYGSQNLKDQFQYIQLQS